MLSYSNDWYQNFTLKYRSFKSLSRVYKPNGRILRQRKTLLNNTWKIFIHYTCKPFSRYLHWPYRCKIRSYFKAPNGDGYVDDKLMCVTLWLTFEEIDGKIIMLVTFPLQTSVINISNRSIKSRTCDSHKLSTTSINVALRTCLHFF